MKEERKKLFFDDIKEKFPRKANDFLKSESLNDYWNFLNTEGTDLNREKLPKDDYTRPFIPVTANAVDATA